MPPSSRRRMLIMLSAQLLVVAIIVARLVTLQVVQEKEIRKEHALIYGGEERLEPIRGRILDRNGAVLAITGYDYRITAAPNQIQDARASASMLASVLITKTYNILSRLEPWVPDGGDPVLYSIVRLLLLECQPRQLRLSENSGCRASRLNRSPAGTIHREGYLAMYWAGWTWI